MREGLTSCDNVCNEGIKKRVRPWRQRGQRMVDTRQSSVTSGFPFST